MDEDWKRSHLAAQPTNDTPQRDDEILETLIEELGRLERVCTAQSIVYARNGDTSSLIEARAELRLVRHLIGVINR